MKKEDPKNTAEAIEVEKDDTATEADARQPERVKEIGGRGGLDPTRYGDWEKNGRCIDF